MYLGFTALLYVITNIFTSFLGPEMYMYDLPYGSHLTSLQIPRSAIESIQSKLTDEGCVITRYTQDCKSLADLRNSQPPPGLEDLTCAREAMVDVGYICRKCHMVYPNKEGCVGHQRSSCYFNSSLPQEKRIVKLEQIQFECGPCRTTYSTLAELITHFSASAHKQRRTTGEHSK